jgi:hypothetical protein
MSLPELYHLQWRGTPKGPWTLAYIQQALQSGDIHSLYQIQTDKGWLPLRDFLNNLPQPALKPPPPTAEQQAAAARLDAELQLRDEYESKFQALENQIAEERRRRREQAATPVQPPPPPQWVFQPPSQPQAPYNAAPTGRTSGLAVASFILSLLFFVPLANIITWILSLVFGHMSLSHMKQDPLLRGRGLAVAALVISYVLMGLGILVVILTPSLYRPLINR